MALSQRMRVGVGITVVDDLSRILVLERRQQPGAWQMPQGGVDDGEELAAAAWRELREETGLAAPQVELVRALPHWVAYELPRAAWSEKTGRGQVQQWFLFRCAGPVALAPTEEARAFAWWPADRVVAATAEFRRAMYEQVLTGFGLMGG
jgi:putative (di)nucleoside polyphosphate hydrolase